MVKQNNWKVIPASLVTVNGIVRGIDKNIAIGEIITDRNSMKSTKCKKTKKKIKNEEVRISSIRNGGDYIPR